MSTFDATAGGAIDLGNDTVTFVVEASSQPLAAETVASVIGGNTGAGTTAGTVNDTSYLYDFALVANGNDFDVTISVANTIEDTVAAGFAATGNTLLTSLSASTNAQINLLQSTLQSQSTASGVEDIVEAVASDVTGGAVQAGVTVAGQTSSITGTRLAALRNDSVVTGMTAGDLSDGVKVWGQAYVQTAEQDERDGVSGYDSDSYGFVAGIDTEALADDLTVGVAFSYGNTEVESKGISNGETGD